MAAAKGEEARLDAAYPPPASVPPSLCPETRPGGVAPQAHFALAFARIENHFFYHRGWYPTEAIRVRVRVCVAGKGLGYPGADPDHTAVRATPALA